VSDDWHCGQSMVALLISQNGPENLSVNASPGKPGSCPEICRTPFTSSAIPASI
jgi:hypothetical protein